LAEPVLEWLDRGDLDGQVARVAKGEIGIAVSEGIFSRFVLSRRLNRRSGMGISTGQIFIKQLQIIQRITSEFL
jgi:hypothetical protein